MPKTTEDLERAIFEVRRASDYLLENYAAIVPIQLKVTIAVLEEKLKDLETVQMEKIRYIDELLRGRTNESDKR